MTTTTHIRTNLSQSGVLPPMIETNPNKDILFHHSGTNPGEVTTSSELCNSHRLRNPFVSDGIVHQPSYFLLVRTYPFARICHFFGPGSPGVTQRKEGLEFMKAIDIGDTIHAVPAERP